MLLRLSYSARPVYKPQLTKAAKWTVCSYS